MSEEAVGQTRRQKRALEREAPPLDDEAPPLDSKRLKMDAGEVKATFKLEVQTRGGPMDASASHTEMKRARRSPSPDDVIVLSDEAPSPRVNGRNLNTDLLMRSSAEHRERVIKQLKEELRLEEVKLILLKKIRHSQEHKDSSGQKPTVSVSAALPVLVKGSTSAKAAQPVVPPPLVRGAQVSKHSHQILMPPLFRGAQVSSSSSGPSPLQPGLIRKTSIPSSSLLVLHQAAGANLQPCSRQAALHKQLEESLLEIPRPRPEPQLSFMPSAAGQQFLSLLGLEEAVQRLLEALGRGKQGLYAGLVVSSEPCCCSQCKTDFTCRWRTDKGGAILCERCMSSNQKKALKAEHTNRLKAVFLKAVQQEQRLLQQATPPAVHGPKPRPLTTSSSVAHGVKPRPLTTSSSAAHGVKPRPLPASIRQVCPSGIRAPPPSSSQLQLVHQTGKHAVRQWSKVSRGRSADPTTSSWRKQSRGAAGVTMAYVNPSLSGHRMSSAEFLLNMIPSRTANSWK